MPPKKKKRNVNKYKGMSNEQLGRAYITNHESQKEFKSEVDALKPLIRKMLSSLPKLGPSKQFINIGDYSLSLRHSKPTRIFNEEKFLLELMNSDLELYKKITKTVQVTRLDEHSLQQAIDDKEISKEEVAKYITEKVREPSIIVDEAMEGDEVIDVDEIEENFEGEEMATILENEFGDLDEN